MLRPAPVQTQGMWRGRGSCRDFPQPGSPSVLSWAVWPWLRAHQEAPSLFSPPKEAATA